MADSKSKPETTDEHEGLSPWYFPDSNQTVWAKDYAAAKESLKKETK